MKVLRKPNHFTIALSAFVLAATIQLGSLTSELISEANLINWVQDLSWPKQTTACTTNCGTEVAVPNQTVEENTEFKPERIVVESIKLEEQVISVPLTNGTWMVNNGVANYAEGTSLVNSKTGNVGLFGHAQANAFLPIKDIALGATITLYGEGYKATYVVTKTDTITPSDVEVFYPTEKPSVTLITCDGPQDIHRYMVRGELVKIEKTQ
jgi:LPXTG-site transpeptidase (sortase) family protein